MDAVASFVRTQPLKGIKKSNAAHSFMQMSLNLDKGFDDGVMEFTKDAYNFATKNAYSKSYWQNKGGEALMGAVFISDINKVRPDGSSNAMDVFNSISNASAYEIGHFTGYNGAQFVTTAALTEGTGMMRIGLYQSF